MTEKKVLCCVLLLSTMSDATAVSLPPSSEFPLAVTSGIFNGLTGKLGNFVIIKVYHETTEW